MENSAKALYMAGTLLISLLVISLFVYSYRNWGGVQQQKDKIAQEENITKFNKEYEAFNKRIMYGVDVISCINKAVSNNEKYVKDGNWSVSGASGQEALVQVEVRLNGDKLKENISIFYFDDKGKERQYSGSIPSKIQNLNLFSILNENMPNANIPKVSSFDDKTTLGKIFENGGEGIIKIDSKNFILLDRDSSGKIRKKFATNLKSPSLYELVDNKTDLEIYIYNKEKDPKYSIKDWSYIKWTTCFSEFKKKKFTCVSDELQYNESTGRIEKIVFQEV